MTTHFTLDARFYRLADDLAPYFTSLYCFEMQCAEGVQVQDQLHPEWSSIRFTQLGTPPVGGIVPQPARPTWPMVASGPTSRAIRFGLTRARIWGLGLLPAGWAAYVAAPANSLADQIVPAADLAAFARFRPLQDLIVGSAEEPDAMARKINACLLAVPRLPVPQAAQILACQEALRDPEIADVEALCARLGIGRRTLERLCARYFGFPPKLLLRRQRFLRSLARYMLEPMQNWSSALDLQYYDHAHFVRDFRSFMGLTPTEYAESPHPVLDRIMAQRMADQGAAPQTDLPTLLRYLGPPQPLD